MSAALSKEQITDCLSGLQDPSQDRDIVSLGLVASVDIKDSNVNIILEVPIHRVAALEPLLDPGAEALEEALPQHAALVHSRVRRRRLSARGGGGGGGGRQ